MSSSICRSRSSGRNNGRPRPAPDPSSTNTVWLLIRGGMLAGIALSLKLWFPFDRLYPAAPFATYLMTTYYRGIPTELVEASVMDGASYWQIFRKVKFPSALPYIFAGLDMAAVFAVVGAIVGEFVGAQLGLGVEILQMNASMDVAGSFSVFIILSIMGLVLNKSIRMVQAKVLFWAPSEAKQRAINV